MVLDGWNEMVGMERNGWDDRRVSTGTNGWNGLNNCWCVTILF